MKKSLLLPILLLFIASTAIAQTVEEQLQSLNKYWQDRHYDDEILQETKTIEDGVPLIQMHLSLVEQKLREETPTTLSKEAYQNRLLCLDILHDYWTNGVFPINTYHSTRTPYFIDSYGTACAVGHLMVNTGFNDVAQKIHEENNYAYIAELDEQYPQLQEWATAYGFEVDELAWIQPGYPPCDGGCTATLAVYTYVGTPPYSYHWSNGDTNQFAQNLCYDSTYTVTVTDSLGSVIPPADILIGYQMVAEQGNSFTLPHVDPVIMSFETSQDYGNCDATAKLSYSGVFDLFSCKWSTTPPKYGLEVDSLCAGKYYATITYNNMMCNKTDSVIITNFTSSINEKDDLRYNIGPNPVSNHLTIEHGYATEKVSIAIYDSFGRIVSSQALTDAVNTIDVSSLSSGIYTVSITAGDKVSSKKIMKNSR